MDGTHDRKKSEVWEVIEISEIERPQSDGVIVPARQPNPQPAVLPRPPGGVIADSAREAFKKIISWVIVAAVIALVVLTIAWIIDVPVMDLFDCLQKENSLSCIEDVAHNSETETPPEEQ